jgi:galactonate dehydratase
VKITAIESLQWQAYPRLMVVRVHTDSGLIGLGETVDKIPAAKGALHGTLAPLLLGQDPLDIEGLWRFVMDNLMYHGYAGGETRALSAVEVALWDIMGKHYGAPLYHLLGGKVRTAIPTYNTCIGTDEVPDYAAWHADAGALAKSLMADGISAMKIWPFDQFSESSLGQRITARDIEQGLTPIRQIRRSASSAISAGIAPVWNASRTRSNRITSCLWRTCCPRFIPTRSSYSRRRRRSRSSAPNC